MQFSLSEVPWIVSRSWDDKTLSITGSFSTRILENATNVWIFLTSIVRHICKSVFPQPTYLSFRICWNVSASSHPDSTTQLFSQSLFCHTPCCCLKLLCTIIDLSISWCSFFQQVKTHTFCCWDKKFAQKKRSSPNPFCEGTESPSTLSSKASLDWNLYLSWSN